MKFRFIVFIALFSAFFYSCESALVEERVAFQLDEQGGVVSARDEVEDKGKSCHCELTELTVERDGGRFINHFAYEVLNAPVGGVFQIRFPGQTDWVSNPVIDSCLPRTGGTGHANFDPGTEVCYRVIEESDESYELCAGVLCMDMLPNYNLYTQNEQIHSARSASGKRRIVGGSYVYCTGGEYATPNAGRMEYWLSTDDQFDPTTDLLLAQDNYQIEPHDNRTEDRERFQYFVPEEMEGGNYYLFFVVDVDDTVYEAEGEADNVSGKHFVLVD